jgi:hypothetical protein
VGAVWRCRDGGAFYSCGEARWSAKHGRRCTIKALITRRGDDGAALITRRGVGGVSVQLHMGVEGHPSAAGGAAMPTEGSGLAFGRRRKTSRVD